MSEDYSVFWHLTFDYVTGLESEDAASSPSSYPSSPAPPPHNETDTFEAECLVCQFLFLFL